MTTSAHLSVAGGLETFKVLVVGAGGIGCEVLKNLVLSGVRQITIVDLDQIDVSNLNRQFLFSKDDVGSYKAEVAAKAIRNYLRPERLHELKVEALRCRIQELPLDRFRDHGAVISALDNLEARRFVNSMCVMNQIPLLEAGSTGRNGQSYPLLPWCGGECFDCRAQPNVTVYPVCTIRLHAEKPEHCVAWARYLFESIFGRKAAADAAAETGDAASDDNALTDLGRKINKLKIACAADPTAATTTFAQRAAIWLFDQQIAELCGTLEANRESETNDPPNLPQPLDWLNGYFSRDNSDDSELQLDSSASEFARQVQTKEYYASQFVRALVRCFRLLKDVEEAKFDKDVEEVMAFVGAASNLRMLNFGIKMLSAWDLKSMAGAIQPAVASTNAIVAGIETMNMLRLKAYLGTRSGGVSTDKSKAESIHCPSWPSLEDLNKQAKLRFVWTRATPSSGRLLIAEHMDVGNRACMVCQMNKSVVELRDFKSWPMRRFVSEILEKKFDAKDATIQDAKTVLYDPDLLEDFPQLGEKTFDSKAQHITVTALNLGAADFIVLENSDLKQVEFNVLRDHREQPTGMQPLTIDSWRNATSAEAETAIDLETGDGDIADQPTTADSASPNPPPQLSGDDEAPTDFVARSSKRQQQSVDESARKRIKPL